MEEQFVPYELVIKLKELGFDEECLGYYRSPTNRIIYGFELHNTPEHVLTVKVPLWQQAFDWFREKGFSFNVDKIHNETDLYHFHINYEWEYFQGTYQEAREACLEKLIELCEKK